MDHVITLFIDLDTDCIATHLGQVQVHVFVINFLTDLVFLFDLVLQFFVMYPKRTESDGTVDSRI